MNDSGDELDQWFGQATHQELLHLLGRCSTLDIKRGGQIWTLETSYQAWDREAVKQQRIHLWLVRWTCICATVAVVLAIFQLARAELAPLFPSDLVHAIFGFMEFGVAVGAFAAVVLGIFSAYAHSWRLRRFLAEQCRFLKFSYLLKCIDSPAEAEKFLSDGLNELHNFARTGRERKVATSPDPKHPTITQDNVPLAWIRRDLEATPVPAIRSLSLPVETLSQLTDYCLKKRIRYQAAYFKRQSHRREKSEHILWWIPISLFFFSLIAAISHGIPELFHLISKATDPAVHAPAEPPAAHPPTTPPNAGTSPSKVEPPAQKSAPHQSELAHFFILGCLLGAAVLPVIGTGFRTYRGALEFARNANRFHSMWVHLWQLEQELQRRRASDDLRGQCEVLRETELALQSEHRSWMRLMVEAEWFG